MSYDDQLAHRVRTHLSRLSGCSERRMFGGLCFLLNGHMTAGIVGPTLMLRVGPERYSELLAEPHARVMDFTGRPLRGMLHVDAAGLGTDEDLGRWLERAVAFVRSQPAKGRSPKPRGRGARNRRR